MAGQCGLCLSCGAPFLPMGEDVVEYDKLGNISVFYFQKLVRTSEVLRKTVGKPTFCSKPQEAHLLHETHHQHAVMYTVDKAADGHHVHEEEFPFMRNPTGSSAEALFARWQNPGAADVLDMKPLADFISGLSTQGELVPDYDNKPRCCHDCNSTMTMRFWFDYHLTGAADGNASKIIPNNSFTVFQADTRGNGNNKIEKYPEWTRGAPEGTYPKPSTSREKQIIGAALGFYLDYSCRPLNTPGLADLGAAGYDKGQHYALYLHMCWVVLEVTCLLSEYWRGSGDAEQSSRTIKHNQCLKTPLGAAELYFSYFCWRIVCFRYETVRGLSFQSWHQIYMWYASDCETLFPREDHFWASKLMADRIAPDDMYMGSRVLVETVARNMTTVLKDNIMKLGRHLSGAKDVHLERYFVPRKYLQDLTILMHRQAIFCM